MPKWQGDVTFDDDYFEDDVDFYEEEYGLDDDYTGFQKIRSTRKSEEEVKGGKKRNSVKHQKRPDKE
jgi:hypothetical protein